MSLMACDESVHFHQRRCHFTSHEKHMAFDVTWLWKVAFVSQCMYIYPEWQFWINVQVYERTAMYKTAERGKFQLEVEAGCDVFYDAQDRFSFVSWHLICQTWSYKWRRAGVTAPHSLFKITLASGVARSFSGLICALSLLTVQHTHTHGRDLSGTRLTRGGLLLLSRQRVSHRKQRAHHTCAVTPLLLRYYTYRMQSR